MRALCFCWSPTTRDELEAEGRQQATLCAISSKKLAARIHEEGEACRASSTQQTTTRKPSKLSARTSPGVQAGSYFNETRQSGLPQSKMTPATANGSPPLMPKTPSPQQSKDRTGFCSSDPVTSNSSHAASSRSDETTSSGRDRSDVAGHSRPQPVQKLQELLFTPPDCQLNSSRNSSGTHSRQGKDGKPPESRRRSADSPSETLERRAKWLRKIQNESMGYPVRQLRMERQPSLEIEGLHDPLEGNSNYQLIQPLNPGSSGSVYRCLDLRHNDEVAIKMVSRGVSNAKAAEREIANLRLCALHPYIIHMREVFLTTNHLAIVFEYAAGGNLAHYIETFQSSKTGRGISEERTRWIFQQIVVAVDYCHKMGIANRDIKLENVLLVPASSTDPTKPPIVKLCDFGFSKDENADSICKTACGTPECVAPEVLTGELYDGKSSDIWSMGVLFFAMLTGTFPFSRPSDDLLDNTASLRKLFHRIAHAQYPKPMHLSKLGLDLLDKMLQPEPDQRIDIAGILNHEWFGRSLQSVALNVNRGLLEMPDAMLTGFAAQTEDEIAEMLHSACFRA